VLWCSAIWFDSARGHLGNRVHVPPPAIVWKEMRADSPIRMPENDLQSFEAQP
jgi:hypothetical protein